MVTYRITAVDFSPKRTARPITREGGGPRGARVGLKSKCGVYSVVFQGNNGQIPHLRKTPPNPSLSAN